MTTRIETITRRPGGKKWETLRHEAWGRRKTCNEYISETFRSNPAGKQSRPIEPGQQSEASRAWSRGDPGCEASAARRSSSAMEPRKLFFVARAHALVSGGGRVGVPYRPGNADLAGVEDPSGPSPGLPRNVGDLSVSTDPPSAPWGSRSASPQAVPSCVRSGTERRDRTQPWYRSTSSRRAGQTAGVGVPS